MLEIAYLPPEAPVALLYLFSADKNDNAINHAIHQAVGNCRLGMPPMPAMPV